MSESDFMAIDGGDSNAVNSFIAAIADQYEKQDEFAGVNAFLLLSSQAFCSVAIANGISDDQVHENVQAMLDRCRELFAEGSIVEGNHGGH